MAASPWRWRKPHSRKDIGATVEQDQSLMAHPLFGLFAEPASTVLLTAAAANIEEIEKLADEFSFLPARIGTTGGDRLEISVDGEPFISAPLANCVNPGPTRWKRSARRGDGMSRLLLQGCRVAIRSDGDARISLTDAEARQLATPAVEQTDA